MTLIELIVSVALIAVVSGLGLAAWTNFQSRRELENEGLRLSSQLRLVKAKAVNGEKPSEPSVCTSLDGYQVSDGSPGIWITPYCDGLAATDDQYLISLESSNISLTFTGFPIIFKSLEGSIGTDSSSTISLSHNLSGGSGTITISQAGEILWQRD